MRVTSQDGLEKARHAARRGRAGRYRSPQRAGARTRSATSRPSCSMTARSSDRLDRLEVVRGQQHDRAGARRPASRSCSAPRRRIVQPGERLVEEHEPRVVQQRALEREPLAHAAREAGDGIVARCVSRARSSAASDAPLDVRQAVEPREERAGSPPPTAPDRGTGRGRAGRCARAAPARRPWPCARRSGRCPTRARAAWRRWRAAWTCRRRSGRAGRRFRRRSQSQRHPVERAAAAETLRGNVGEASATVKSMRACAAAQARRLLVELRVDALERGHQFAARDRVALGSIAAVAVLLLERVSSVEEAIALGLELRAAALSSALARRVCRRLPHTPAPRIRTASASARLRGHSRRVRQPGEGERHASPALAPGPAPTM